jgi:hypothetical protein
MEIRCAKQLNLDIIIIKQVGMKDVYVLDEEMG